MLGGVGGSQSIDRVDQHEHRPVWKSVVEFSAEQCLFGIEQQVAGVGAGAAAPGVAPDLAGQFADHDGDDVVGQVAEFPCQGGALP